MKVLGYARLFFRAFVPRVLGGSCHMEVSGFGNYPIYGAAVYRSIEVKQM